MLSDKKIIKYLIGTVNLRDIEVVNLLANDLRPFNIAKELGVGVRNIESIILKLRNKFECKSVAGLVVIFFRNGIIK